MLKENGSTWIYCNRSAKIERTKEIEDCVFVWYYYRCCFSFGNDDLFIQPYLTCVGPSILFPHYLSYLRAYSSSGGSRICSLGGSSPFFFLQPLLSSSSLLSFLFFSLLLTSIFHGVLGSRGGWSPLSPPVDPPLS